MHSTHPYDLVIGLDRSDRKADLYSIHTLSGKTDKQIISTSPEALHDWLAQLRQEHPEGRVAICLEQPAANLILFLETYSWLTLYAINKASLDPMRFARSALGAGRACRAGRKTTARTRSIWPSCSGPITPNLNPGSPMTARRASCNSWCCIAAPSSMNGLDCPIA